MRDAFGASPNDYPDEYLDERDAVPGIRRSARGQGGTDAERDVLDRLVARRVLGLAPDEPVAPTMMITTLLPLLASHVHYCPEHDRRWVCADDPCLKHHAAPCPDRAHSGGLA